LPAVEASGQFLFDGGIALLQLAEFVGRAATMAADGLLTFP